MASLLKPSTSHKEEAPKTKNSMLRRKRKEQQARHPPVDDDDDDEEQRLTAQLFGTKDDTPATATNFQSHLNKKKRPEESADEFTFAIDRIGSSATGTSGTQNNLDPNETEENEEEEDYFPKTNAIATSTASNRSKTVAWVDRDDDDDENAVDFTHTADRIRKLRQNKQETHVTRSLYEERLRQRYIQTTQTTSNVAWAKTATIENTTNHQTDPTHVHRSISASYVQHDTTTTTRKFIPQPPPPPPHLISMKRCPDANRSDPHQSVTKVVQFYRPPTVSEAPALLLTAGLDKTLRFFQCSEEASTKIHGVHFPNFPIYSASFIGTSSNVVVTGRRPFFYIYDTVADQVQKISKIPNRPEKSWERCVVSPHDNDTIALLGNDGYIVLYNILQQKACTTQPIKLNGSVRAVAFNPYNCHELLASGSDGDIYRYDIRYNNHKCIERFPNEDGTITSQIATSPSTFAVAAESGVVNIYKNNNNNVSNIGSSQQSPSLLRGLSTPTFPVSHQHRKPIKSIMNIKTCVDTMSYNHDGNLLAISSRFEKDCLKLVHIPTGSVYSNWPTSNTPLGYVFSMDFSPHSNYLAIGNDQGKCLLYKLMHYG